MALPIAIPTIPPVDTDESSSVLLPLLDGTVDETVVEVINGAALVVLVDNMAAVMLLPKQPSAAHGLVKQQPMNAIGVNSQVYHKPVETHVCGSISS